MNAVSMNHSFSPEPPPIIQKKEAKNDARIRILVLTANRFKQKEFEQDLAVAYGANVTFAEPPETGKVSEEYIRNILSVTEPSPHFIIREESQLYNAASSQPLSGFDIVEEPEKAPPFINSTAKLRVWKPIWNKDSQLEKLDVHKYFHQIKGYIDSSRRALRNESIFGWDHLFVDACSGMTHWDSIQEGCGKIAPRQLVISDFIMGHLFYKEPKGLSHHCELKPMRAIEFSPEMSVSQFMENSPFLSNPHIGMWGLDEIRGRILNEGAFFKAARSRPIRNYFTPPFGGIPLTAKKSDVEETVFMMHDLNHHNIPDLIFGGDDSPEMLRVYMVWRMMSEAMTLVIADMLYADTLVKTNPENRSQVDSRIYPLFEALDIESPSDENRWEIIKKLLWANTQYAILGDDTEWKALLKPGFEERLTAYKNHFEKFFVGDHVWTNANFKNMAAKKEFYRSWLDRMGEDHFRSAGLLLLDDMAEKLRKQGADLSSTPDVVRCVFNEIFENRIHPKDDRAIQVDEAERISRGFRRYMIGQMSFYSHYESIPSIKERGDALAEKIRTTPFFGEIEREELLKQYKQDVYYLWGLGVITTDSADNHMQVHPIFPPVYISYGKQECKSVKEVLEKLYSRGA